MNDLKRMSKLKSRNRILAIAIAFLLLTLMIPKAVFANESMDANINNVVKEVNTSKDLNVAANEIAVTGKVLNPLGEVVVSGSVGAYKNSVKVGDSEINLDGLFNIEFTQQVQENEPIMLIVRSNGLAFDVIDTYVGAKNLSIKLKDESAVTIKPYVEAEHASYKIVTKVGDQQSTENFDEVKTFAYSFPVGGTFEMTQNAHLLFKYMNSQDEAVQVEITSVGAQWYRPYFWVAKDGDADPYYLKIAQPYTLKENVPYTMAIFYKGQAALNFSSNSQAHEAFHFKFVKNGITMHDMVQASFETTTHEGTEFSVKDDGTIQMYFLDSDDVNAYEVISTIEPIAKTGYKFAGWTYNGKELKAGDKFTAELMSTMNFIADYKVDASSAPATGDLTYIIIIAIFLVVSTSGILMYRISKK